VPSPLLDLAGGPDTLRAVVRDFYDTVFADLMIGFFFRHADKERLIAHELEVALHALGADVPYTGRPLRAVHAPHPIMGGHFMRRRKLLADAMERHRLPAAVREAWLAHTDALRAEITPDAGGECDGAGAA
jgi:hemoglobin